MPHALPRHRFREVTQLAGSQPSNGGETTIGEGSTIGANVTLMHSVPPNSLVVTKEAGIQILDKNAKKTKKEVGEFSI